MTLYSFGYKKDGLTLAEKDDISFARRNGDPLYHSHKLVSAVGQFSLPHHHPTANPAIRYLLLEQILRSYHILHTVLVHISLDTERGNQYGMHRLMTFLRLTESPGLVV